MAVGGGDKTLNIRDGAETRKRAAYDVEIVVKKAIDVVIATA